MPRTPPIQMIERQPYLLRFVASGEGNSLGARALYLGDMLYRIHGTNQPSTIGTPQPLLANVITQVEPGCWRRE